MKTIDTLMRDKAIEYLEKRRGELSTELTVNENIEIVFPLLQFGDNEGVREMVYNRIEENII